MPRNGSGNYSLPTNAWNPAINGVSATPADWQALINDVAAAIQASVSADGQTPVTGNLQMGGHLLTGAGAPSGTGMSLRWEQLTRGDDIPSAASITIPLEGQFFAVTGSTPITGFNATIAGRLVYIKFDAGIVLTNSASFILPGGVNITTQADDIAVFLSVSIGVWKCVSYPRVQDSAASSDHYGATAPTTTYAGMTWADSGTNTLWRRDAANASWVNEGVLFQRAQPGMTAAQIAALTADQGPITCTDQDGILYAWSAGQTKYVAQVADNPTALARASSTTLLTPAALGFAEQPVKTASVQFVRATNEILMNAIVTDLGLEIGDVIQITGSVNNNFTMTVEVITDANDINVNYAHRNGAGSLSLTDETVTCTVKRISKWYNAPLGLGQAWLSTARPGSTTFTNSTKRSIGFSASAGQTANVASRFWISVNGLLVSVSGGSVGGQNVGVSAVVPAGGAYLYATDTGSSLGGYQTFELR